MDPIVFPILALLVLLGVFLIWDGVRQIKRAESNQKVHDVGTTLSNFLVALLSSPWQLLMVLFPMKGRRPRPGEIEYAERERGAYSGTYRIMTGIGFIGFGLLAMSFFCQIGAIGSVCSNFDFGLRYWNYVRETVWR